MFGLNRLRKKQIGLSDDEFDEYKNKQHLRMWRLPWGLWIMSGICFAAGTFLVASLTVLEIIEGFDSYWPYLIIIMFFLMSSLFFLSGKIEVVTFDKESGSMYKTKSIFCYVWKSLTIPLKEIVDVNLVLCGSNNKYSSTLYYKLTIITKYSKPIGILETKNRKKVIEKALKVRAFFNIKGKIPLKDISLE